MSTREVAPEIEDWAEAVLLAELTNDPLVTEYSLIRKRIRYLKLRTSAASEIEVCQDRLHSVRVLLFAKVKIKLKSTPQWKPI